MARDTFTVDDLVKIADYLGMQVVLKGEKEYIIKKRRLRNARHLLFFVPINKYTIQ